VEPKRATFVPFGLDRPEHPLPGEVFLIEEFSEIAPSVAKRAWARLIKQVYEVDPLLCPRCAGPMRIIAFIEQPEVIAKILTHLGLWPACAHSPPAPALAA
jgi:hypothetical protein